MRFKDWTGQRFGNLVVIGYEQKVIKSGQQWIKAIIWTCRCDCGNSCEMPSHRFAITQARISQATVGRKPKPMSCEECTARSEQEKIAAIQRRREQALLARYENSPYMRDYEQYREGFTPEQRARYEEALGGRHGEQMEREAVDVVMREPVPGICCERCLRGEPMPEEATENEDEQQDG